jgi:MFS family permease
VYAIAGLPLGRAADLYNRRNVIITGVAIWSLMTSLCGLARSFPLLLVCRAGVGVGEAALSPAAYSMLSDSFEPKRLALAMSIYNLGPSLGSGLALLLGGAILQFAGDARFLDLGLPLLHAVRPWQVTFVILGALGLVVIALLFTIIEPARRYAAHERHEAAGFAETLGFVRREAASVGALLAGLALLGVLSYATMTWYPTMFVRTFDQAVGRTGLVFGPLYIVTSIAGNFLGAWFATRLADRGVRAPYVRWSVIAAVMVTVLGTVTPLMPSLTTTYAAAGLLVLAQSSWMGSAVAGLHLAVPNQMRGQLTAILLLCTNLVGLSLGPSVVAAITQYGFGDSEFLRYSLAIVSAAAGSLSILLLRISARHFPKLTAAPRAGASG